jgi:hypothetical protein
MTIRGRALCRVLIGSALLTALVLAVSAGSAVASEPEPEPSFCEIQTLHDYLAPLRRMPKLRELPYRTSHEFRFRGVHIEASGPSLAINGGRAGYQLQWDKNPGWDLTLTVEQVNRKGESVLWVGRRDTRLGRLAPAQITEPSFAMRDKPGFYRSVLVIRSDSGRKLARFGNYFRVVRPTVQARLVTDATSYQPGATLFARVENPGASVVLFGESFSVQHLEGGSWAAVPAAPGPFSSPLQFVAAGVTSHHCPIFPIPTSMPPGRYRLAQEAVISWPFQSKQLRPMLYAEFEVGAPTL